MNINSLKVLLCALTLSFSAGALALVCVEEGKSIPVVPNAPSCCEGLTLVPAPAGMMGSKGTCEKKKVACVEEGKSIPVIPNAPECCKGLSLVPPAPGIVGSKGKCVNKSNCVKEGGTVVVYPNAPQCCEGLKLQPPIKGLLGSAGTCVTEENNQKVSELRGRKAAPENNDPLKTPKKTSINND